jgi:NAD-dependent dihydropyrimidine dehydrogenase PreA subunit
METMPASWVKEIRIDLAKCKGCKSCMNACFVDEEHKNPVVAYPEDCVWCLACEAACAEQCIEVIPKIPAPLRSSY